MVLAHGFIFKYPLKKMENTGIVIVCVLRGRSRKQWTTSCKRFYEGEVHLKLSNATPWQSTPYGAFFERPRKIHLQKMDPQMWVNVLKGTCYNLYNFFYYTIIVLIGGTNNIQCIVKYSGYNYISRWWFQTCFIFPYIWNSNPNWLSYFSEGLKPPILYIYCIKMYPW
jgi:hypothetical protein